MSISSINCSWLGFVFVFVVVALESICGGDGKLNDRGGGGSWTRSKLVGGGGGYGRGGMKLLNDGGCGGSGMKLLNDDGCSGGDKSLPLLLLKLRLSFFSASNLFCMSISTRGSGAFLTRLLGTSVFTNVKLSKQRSNNRILSIKSWNILKNKF